MHRGIREESPREVRREKREGRIGKTAGQREQNEESREKNEERSEKRETSTIKMRGSKDTMVRSQNKGRPLGEKREERREKREERDKHDEDERVEGGNGSVPEWRDGTEKGWSLRGKRAERSENRGIGKGRREQRLERRYHESSA